MKRFFYVNVITWAICLLTSCQIADVVFNAGAISGIILIAILTAIVIYVLAKVLGKRRKSLDTKED